MYRFWETLVRPLLDARQPRTLLEIGSFEGEHTRLLLDYCQAHDAILHAIDPLPRFDAEAWQAASQGHFVFHRAKSLEVLRSIEPVDVALIDGDHNWYTVYHELGQLASVAARHEHLFPITLFHDIGWPYARRDLYYDPDDIPVEFQQPYKRQGIWPGRSRLHKYGINEELANADHEGGPRNGVLTAVEDFLAEQSEPMQLILISGFHGLGILYPEALGSEHPQAAVYLGNLATSVAMLDGHVRKLDDQIISTVVRAHRQRRRDRETANLGLTESQHSTIQR
jgi:hypothetical protein